MSSKDHTVLSLEDIERFKLLGGFNDDWDCCYGLLVYLLSLDVQKRTTSELKNAVRLKEFARQIRLRPLGVPQIAALLGRPAGVTIENISRLFQEIYLGKDLFKTIERKYPLYWKKNGLIRREKLVFKKRILEKLKKAGLKLGITTGRCHFEAVYALKRFGIFDYFDAITTSDEVKKAEEKLKRPLRKPNPYSLLQTDGKLGLDKKLIYVGDLPDDIFAVSAAKKSIRIKSVAFPTLSSSAEDALMEIQHAKPDYMIRSPAELVSLLGLST